MNSHNQESGGRRISLSEYSCRLAESIVLKRSLWGAGGLKPVEVRMLNFFLANQDCFDPTNSHSQLMQDLWVLFLVSNGQSIDNGATDKFFVEFGALDGITCSNTLMLEEEFGWDGLLAEPAPEQYEQCKQNRKCAIDPRCVWSSTGELLAFNTVKGSEELATIDHFSAEDMHASTRGSNREIIEVETTSLLELLEAHNAPRTIDYLSVDTEGSEFEILSAFDFSQYEIRVVSVEHNFSKLRRELDTLMQSNGFKRVKRSYELFDDMYVRADLLEFDPFI